MSSVGYRRQDALRLAAVSVATKSFVLRMKGGLNVTRSVDTLNMFCVFVGKWNSPHTTRTHGYNLRLRSRGHALSVNPSEFMRKTSLTAFYSIMIYINVIQTGLYFVYIIAILHIYTACLYCDCLLCV